MRYGTSDIAGAVAQGVRPLGYWEVGEAGKAEAVREARRNALLKVARFGRLPLFGSYWWVYRKDNEVEAFRRICLLVHARKSSFLFPAWEYLHGAILGYSPRDIAYYFTAPNHCAELDSDLADAYRVYESIQASVRQYLEPGG